MYKEHLRVQHLKIPKHSSLYYFYSYTFILFSKHPTPMTIQLHPQCLLGIQGILRNWTFLIFKQV